ncbi:hypothetical protein [Caballeronia humi]|uniref:Transmembrane protein n=1 Tax=Caballeronia humi TaxID=326474 RepID=A0A158JK70_9BURK|nr:hypothetical protein [Caballeronia humi]SAL68740.1 hypothetical protein AWB65_06752 [Caballeronia humi]
MPAWVQSSVELFDSWWPYIATGAGGIAAFGGFLKWLYDIRKARAEDKERTEAAAKKNKRVHIPTFDEVEQALKEYDRYERLRVERLRRIQSRGTTVKVITEEDKVEAEKYAAEQLDLSPAAAGLVADDLLLRNAQRWQKVHRLRTLRSSIPPWVELAAVALASMGVLLYIAFDGNIAEDYWEIVRYRFQRNSLAVAACVLLLVCLAALNLIEKHYEKLYERQRQDGRLDEKGIENLLKVLQALEADDRAKQNIKQPRHPPSDKLNGKENGDPSRTR